MKYERIVVGALSTNCYLVYCEKTFQCAIVDPGAEPEVIFRMVEDKNLNPVAIINTHGHVDHIGANRDVKEKYDIPIYIHSGDRHMLDKLYVSVLGSLIGAKKSPPPDIILEDESLINIGETSLKVLHTPGHSPGSASFLGDDFILSGDTLFNNGVGRTDLPGGSWEELENSIKTRIYVLPDELVVLPGHGPITTVKQEKDSNLYVQW
ncbi:MAG: MBL fold metallo-hydrolase [Candidatus Aminicenantaceae bacterium]